MRLRSWLDFTTGILYHQPSPQHEARVIAWGLEAKSATVREGIFKCVHACGVALYSKYH